MFRKWFFGLDFPLGIQTLLVTLSVMMRIIECAEMCCNNAVHVLQYTAHVLQYSIFQSHYFPCLVLVLMSVFSCLGNVFSMPFVTFYLKFRHWNLVLYCPYPVNIFCWLSLSQVKSKPRCLWPCLINSISAQFQLNVWICSEIMVDGWDGCINNHKMFIQNFLFIFHFQLKLVNIEILFSLCGRLYSTLQLWPYLFKFYFRLNRNMNDKKVSCVAQNNEINDPKTRTVTIQMNCKFSF